LTSASDQLRPGGPSPDEAGFREWVSLRAPGLRRKAYLLCGDWHAADDLVQDALITLYTTWPRVARGNNIDAYASRVLVHKFIDDKRRPWRRQHVTETVPECTDPRAREAFERVERRDGPLAAALATLPVQQRAVLVLRYIDDLAVDDIARVLDLPAGTVKSRLSRGIDALRTQLETNGYTDASTTPHAPSPGTEGTS
jgi:RNA polymerase sigma-70 factor (sigma-E family)